MRSMQSALQNYPHLIAACLLALALALLAQPLYAQTAAESGVGGDFTQEQLQSAAQASLAVERINKEWAPRMEDATTQEEINAVRRQANTQMVQAIEAAGLDVNTYVEIIEMSQADPELNDRLMRHRNALQ